ncbi:MAG TPA: DnaB-like helicase N-terminal domain-containing protein [Blastocatellia bacterium]|nr:DnaB-like helicase N-terminal domain-containing protein [Blastocatellia bacterium]
MERDPLLEKGLPSDVEAEKAVLGAISLNNGLLTQALSYLEKKDFFLDSHSRIFDAMVSLKESGNPIDTVTLPTLLTERNELQQVGGVTYLASLIDGVPQTDNIEHYCRIIKYKASERKAINLLNTSIIELIDGEEQLDTTIQRIQSELAKITASNSKKRAISGVYTTLDALFNAQIDEPEQILFGLHRGEVAGLFAVTNYGKSTLLCNSALSIAAGETIWPLAPLVPKPRRVVYIDSESPASRSKADLQTMIGSISDDKTARENFSIMVDALIKDSPLSLSNADHFNGLIAFAKSRKADLVIVDTAASAFELVDENSNAEITRRVMNPLKRLAREANCAVIFTHHIGKATETQTGEAAYKGRGASAFGALSRTIFTIEKDAKKGPGYIVLNCAKIKGQPFEPVLLKLNTDTRWFEMCSDSPSAKPAPPTAQEIAAFVEKRTEVRTGEICEHFEQRAGRRTIEDRIRDAERLGLIYKANQKAPWRFRNGKEGDSAESAERPTESTDSGFPQSANPIRDCTNAQTGSNGDSQASRIGCCPICGRKGERFSNCLKCGEVIRGI